MISKILSNPSSPYILARNGIRIEWEIVKLCFHLDIGRKARGLNVNLVIHQLWLTPDPKVWQAVEYNHPF